MSEMNDTERDRSTRCIEVIEAYGADPARWPAAEREALLALSADSPDAHPDIQRALEAARDLDAALDRAALPDPAPELMADILAAAAPSRARQWLGLLWPFGPVWQPVSAFALAAVLGFTLGTAVPNPFFPASPSAESSELLAGETDALVLSPRDMTEAL